MPRFPIAMPTGHFMGLAPLDVWARLLLACRGRIGPRYWLRLISALATSLLATLITLPERLLLWPLLRVRFGGRAPRYVPARDAVVIVGYFRSGTTHLHNLLATHPDVVTPRWVQAMSPQGFWLSWSFLRLALVPFLPNTRPQDDVAFGPDWPAEDDFAHNNWALASTLPGRLVLPQERRASAGFANLDGLTARELTRWRRAAAAFAWKVSAASRGRKHLLLKSPTHTGKVRELDRLFDGNVRFVHLARAAEDVVRSNVAMHARLEGQSLQRLPSEEETREAVIAEYVEAEERFLADADWLKRHRLEAGATGIGATGIGATGIGATGIGATGIGGTGFQPVRVRYTELVSQPLDELARICEAVGLRWDDQVRGRATTYLDAVGDYTPRQHTERGAAPDPRLAALDATFLHDPAADEHPRAEPCNDTRHHPHGSESRGTPLRARAESRRVVGVLAVWIAAALGLGLWLLLAHFTHRRLDVLAWPLGGAVGAVAFRVVGRGDWKLGLWAAAGALALVAGSVWPLPEVAHGWGGTARYANLRTTYGSFNNNYLYPLFGMLTAYRYASRRFARPPGM